MREEYAIVTEESRNFIFLQVESLLTRPGNQFLTHMKTRGSQPGLKPEFRQDLASSNWRFISNIACSVLLCGGHCFLHYSYFLARHPTYLQFSTLYLLLLPRMTSPNPKFNYSLSLFYRQYLQYRQYVLFVESAGIYIMQNTMVRGRVGMAAGERK